MQVLLQHRHRSTTPPVGTEGRPDLVHRPRRKVRGYGGSPLPDRGIDPLLRNLGSTLKSSLRWTTFYNSDDGLRIHRPHGTARGINTSRTTLSQKTPARRHNNCVAL
jgi:hypothetical protein